MVSFAQWLGVVCLCVACGCYKHHRREDVSDASADVGVVDDASYDAATDALIESGVDAGTDGGTDAGLDAMIDSGVDAGLDGTVDAGCSARVPEDYPTLQDALDQSPCDPIIVTQNQRVRDVTVHRSVTILSPSEGVPVAIVGDGNSRVMTLNAGIAVTLQHLVIQDGVGEMGAGIYSQAALTLRDVTVQGNRAESSAMAFGAGLLQMGAPLQLEGIVTFRSNIVEASAAFGGGLYSDSAITATGTLRFVDNHARGAYQALGGAAALATIRAERLEANDNTATIAPSASPLMLTSAYAAGGALALFGDAEIGAVVLTENTVSASDVAGSIGLQVGGGALQCVNRGRVVLRSGSVVSNIARANLIGAGGRVDVQGGAIAGICDLQTSDMTLVGNTATAIALEGGVARAGGGAMACEGASWQIERTVLRENAVRANIGGSGVALDPSWARGGAVSVTDCVLAVRDTLVSSSTAELHAEDNRGANDFAAGGGLAFTSLTNMNTNGTGTVRLERTSIVLNSVQAEANGPTTRALGGGVYAEANRVFSYPLVVSSSTVSHNHVRASDSAGDDNGIALGGALMVDSNIDSPISVEILNATITNNSVGALIASAAAIAVSGTDHENRVGVEQSIVWGNLVGTDVINDCGGSVLHGSRNLVSDLDCFTNATASNRNLDPELEQLTPIDNRCLVHQLSPSSPARNGGDPTLCTGNAAVDQCGRPRTGTCDIGAVEANE